MVRDHQIAERPELQLHFAERGVKNISQHHVGSRKRNDTAQRGYANVYFKAFGN